MPDFAQLIQMETKGIKHFLNVLFTDEKILHKTTKFNLRCAETLPLCSFCLIALTHE